MSYELALHRDLAPATPPLAGGLKLGPWPARERECRAIARLGLVHRWTLVVLKRCVVSFPGSSSPSLQPHSLLYDLV